MSTERKYDLARIGCPDCALLIAQLGETRLDERKKLLARVLHKRVLPPKGEWDVCRNHTLEEVARLIADLR